LNYIIEVIGKRKAKIFRSIAVGMLLLLLSGCRVLNATAAAPTAIQASVSPVVQVVVYQAGPEWDINLPPEQQALSGHLEMVEELFAKGELLANGPTLDDFHGMYLFDVNADEIKDTLAEDQGVQSGVLQMIRVESWQLLLENLDADVGNNMLFVLNYTPGPNWMQGKSMFEQDINDHIAHVTSLFENQQLLAGGPVTDQQGRYIVAAENVANVYSMIGQDPAVKENLFVVQVKPWAPFNRQSIKR